MRPATREEQQETAIFICAYHSQPGQDLKRATGHFASVEKAIMDGEWPYDNGDDPSFYVARHRGPLTWGVCRTDVRSAIRPGDVVVFISFTEELKKQIAYRLCAVATVAEKIEHTRVAQDQRFLSHPYINVLIRRENGDWIYDETDRRLSARHGDWLWRIAQHERSETKEHFKERHQAVYVDNRFKDEDSGLSSARNYVVFAENDEETFILARPLLVALAEKTQKTAELRRERWSNKVLKDLTVSMCTGRGYLRTGNSNGPNHPHIRFVMDVADATRWKKQLIETLKGAESSNAS
jgi:hypothetical protein